MSEKQGTDQAKGVTFLTKKILKLTLYCLLVALSVNGVCSLFLPGWGDSVKIPFLLNTIDRLEHHGHELDMQYNKIYNEKEACIRNSKKLSIEKNRLLKTRDSIAEIEAEKAKPPRWTRYHSDTAIAVRILEAVYTRQLSFCERKGNWALEVSALERPYVKGPEIPKLPQGWKLELGIGGTIIISSIKKFSIRADGCIIGFSKNGISAKRLDWKRDSIGAFNKIKINWKKRSPLEIVCKGYVSKEVKRNPLSVIMVDADKDSFVFIDNKWEGLYYRNGINAGEGGYGPDESGAITDKYIALLVFYLNKPLSSYYDFTFTSTVKTKLELNIRKCPQILYPGSDLKLRIDYSADDTGHVVQPSCP